MTEFNMIAKNSESLIKSNTNNKNTKYNTQLHIIYRR